MVDGAGRTYVPGPTSTPVALVGAGRRLGLHHGLGQRIEAVTGEDGGLIERVSYSAFGSPSFFKADGSEVGGSTVGLGVLVSGQAYVPELGLHRLGARWYQPRWGRFLTPDPAGFVDGPHRFAFVGNQPLAFVDPSGLDKVPSDYGMRLWIGEALAESFVPPNHRRALRGGVGYAEFWSGQGGAVALDNFDRYGAARVDELGDDAQFWAMQGVEVAGAATGVVSEAAEVGALVSRPVVRAAVSSPHGVVQGISDKSIKSFYSVQDAKDANRLANGGEPFPSAPERAHLGEGVYTFESFADAETYLTRIQRRIGADVELQIVRLDIEESALQRLKAVDLRGNDVLAEEFVSRHSRLYGDGLAHDFEYVIRPTAMAPEHFLRALPCDILSLRDHDDRGYFVVSYFVPKRNRGSLR